ncbi:hypothetical protein CRI94_04000 [Longibacter salinarum]|uniref:Peptidase S9A N-terminal domain-containing protein n=1 Tax=Longibacter salinarum TaxID=1850348 RepID=A0A2A8D009_9BACT|nr:hypothetical protein CRI94_04000 [Longibacter salinarum]
MTVHALDGLQEREVELPAIGSITRMTASPMSDHVYYGFDSYTHPTSIYHADLSVQSEQVFLKPEISGFDADRYAVKRHSTPARTARESRCLSFTERD